MRIYSVIKFISLVSSVISQKYIVSFKNNNLTAILGEVNIISRIGERIIVVDKDDVGIFRNNPDVEYIEEDFEVNCNVDQFNPVWGLSKISNKNNVYSYPEDQGVSNVFVIDTGIDVNHPEFEGRAVWGANFVDNNNSDCNNHGTHVAGTIGSKTYGVHKKAKLFGVKVLNCQGSGSSSGVMAGVQWAIDYHKNNSCKKSVINMSLGGGGSSNIFQSLLDEAFSLGVVTVVAAGNEYSDACLSFPAGYNNVITVGATTSSDSFASFSNYGRCVDILAPGQNIESTIPGGSVAVYSGTSMASPHVAGVVSLMMSYCDYSSSSILAKLLSRARDNTILGVPNGTTNKMAFSDEKDVGCPKMYCSTTSTSTTSTSTTSTSTTSTSTTSSTSSTNEPTRTPTSSSTITTPSFVFTTIVTIATTLTLTFAHPSHTGEMSDAETTFPLFQSFPLAGLLGLVILFV